MAAGLRRAKGAGPLHEEVDALRRDAHDVLDAPAQDDRRPGPNLRRMKRALSDLAATLASDDPGSDRTARASGPQEMRRSLTAPTEA